MAGDMDEGGEPLVEPILFFLAPSFGSSRLSTHLYIRPAFSSSGPYPVVI